jgi:two-component system response regulator PilR (NtrC family)
MRLPDGTGLDLLRRMDDSGRREKGIVITAYGSAENAVEALKAGAYDYLTKPVDLRQFRAVVAFGAGPAPAPVADGPAPAPRDRSADVPAPRSGRPTSRRRRHRAAAPGRRVGGHAAGALADREGGAQHGAGAGAGRVGHRQGTGGARHPRLCRRAPAPFVAVNCGAIPETLLEAEFFGYRKGAFTGANEDREGFFQAAQGGTLFLDEIGDLPLSMQSKLLRVIQERAVRRWARWPSCRSTCASSAPRTRTWAPRWQAGRFRQDLYYRLNVIQICVPPLRERWRPARHLRRGARAHRRDAGVTPVPELTAGALQHLRAMPSRATCANWRTCCTARWRWPAARASSATTSACPKTAAGQRARPWRPPHARVAGRRARHREAAAHRPGGLPGRRRARHPRARAGAPPLQPHRRRRQPGPVAAPDALPHGAPGRRRGDGRRRGVVTA